MYDVIFVRLKQDLPMIF